MPVRSADFLPQPFKWIVIPKGHVTVKKNKNAHKERQSGYFPDHSVQYCSVPTFEIGKYPVTNAQYACFLEANGYQQRRYWTQAGWRRKDKNGWLGPQFWYHAQWNKPDYPVVGISWYEAAAYCTWLSEFTGEGIMLPTEQQWLRAARGDTKRELAWGKAKPGLDFMQDYCNWNYDDSTPEGTTPVTKYEGINDSRYGAVDMTGNVWEYCSTKYNTDDDDLEGTDYRVAKGGSWMLFYSYWVNINLEDRLDWEPDSRCEYVGFRLASAYTR